MFDTRVKVELGQRKGKIVVEFASLDDLERIVRSIAPELTQSQEPRRQRLGAAAVLNARSAWPCFT